MCRQRLSGAAIALCSHNTYTPKCEEPILLFLGLFASVLEVQ